MSAITDTEFLTDSLLTEELACEHSQHYSKPALHAGPAWGVIRVLDCPLCGLSGTSRLMICSKIWDSAHIYGIKCFDCGSPFARSDLWILLHVL